MAIYTPAGSSATAPARRWNARCTSPMNAIMSVIHSSLIGGLLVVNHQIDGYARQLANTIRLLRPDHTREEPVKRRVRRHDDRIGTVPASLCQNPPRGVARAS